MIGEEEVANAIAQHADVGCHDAVCTYMNADENCHCARVARAAITAHLAALEAAGWKCVPIEATEEMLAERIGFDLWRANAREFWRRLVRIAPAPPAQNGDER